MCVGLKPENYNVGLVGCAVSQTRTRAPGRSHRALRHAPRHQPPHVPSDPPGCDRVQEQLTAELSDLENVTLTVLAGSSTGMPCTGVPGSTSFR